VPFLLNPYISFYTSRGLSGAVHVLFVAADDQRARLADTHSRERRREVNARGSNSRISRRFFFDDDTFAWAKNRTIAVCEKLKPLKTTWSCTSRVHTDYETLKAMKEAGCRLLIVGFESGDPQILKNIKKGATVEQAREFMKHCKKLGIVGAR